MVNLETELRSPATLRQFRLLSSIEELASESRHRSADTAVLYQDADTFGVDRRSFESDLEALLDDGLIFYEKTSGRPSDVAITQHGIDLARDFQAILKDPRKRARAVRDALLQWLYDEHLLGRNSPNINEFPDSKYGSFYGRSYTDVEIKQATLALRELQLIRGKAGMGGPIIRPEISPRGIREVEEQDKPTANAAREIEDLISVADKGETAPAERIFIVHGHDDARKFQLARFLRDLTGHEPVILHEQANRGSVLIEKLENSAATTGFAVVLLTGDDVGRVKTETTDKPRGRQNVVFELGFFIGALGRSKVAVLKEPDVEEPGDVTGLVYTPLDTAGAWKSALATEIQAAGIPVEWSALGR